MADFTVSVPDEVVGVQPPSEVDPQQIAETVSVVEPEVPVQTSAEVIPEAITPEVVSEPIYKTIQVGHGSFEIDSAATPEDIDAARLDYINNDIDFYKGMDRTTGASWSATKAVGDAFKPEDKLATLKKFYSDVMPFGDDNFIFTNTDTGKVTLYNVPLKMS